MIENITLDQLTLSVNEEIRVQASLESTFEALLEQIGPANETPSGDPLPMTIEAWPGGRWFRDLGSNNGHFWGVVQAIKRPALLEISGPLFMSSPVMSNLQYRLTPVEGGTLITFRHTALGFVPEEVHKNLSTGWAALNERIRRRAIARSSH